MITPMTSTLFLMLLKVSFTDLLTICPAAFSSSLKDSLINAAKLSVQANAIDQYKKIKVFFEEEYFPNTRKRFRS